MKKVTYGPKVPNPQSSVYKHTTLSNTKLSKTDGLELGPAGARDGSRKTRSLRPA